MHPDDAKRFHVSDRDVVEVSINSDGRDLTFGDVLVRVSPKYVLEMHIDTCIAETIRHRYYSCGICVY